MQPPDPHMDANIIHEIQKVYNKGYDIPETFKHFKQHFRNIAEFRKFIANRLDYRSRSVVASKNKKKYGLKI